MGKISSAIGVLISILAITFLVSAIFTHAQEISGLLIKNNTPLILLCGSFSYAFALVFVGASWHALMKFSGDRSLSLLRSIQIFARTQPLKYIPSNIFHFVGRFTFAIKQGSSKGTLALAQGMEIALMALTSLTISILFSSELIYNYLKEYTKIEDTEYFYLYIYTIIIIILLLSVFISQKLRVIDLSAKSIYYIYISTFLYSAFFFMNAGILVGLTYFFYGPMSDWTAIVGVAAAGWLLGFVVPGSPGGLGVREAVLVTGLLTLGVPPAAAATISVAHRLITILGDSLLWLIEWAFRKMVRA